MATRVAVSEAPRFPILALLHPRERTPLMLAALGMGLALWAAAVWLLRRPAWVGAALARRALVKLR